MNWNGLWRIRHLTLLPFSLCISFFVCMPWLELWRPWAIAQLAQYLIAKSSCGLDNVQLDCIR